MNRYRPISQSMHSNLGSVNFAAHRFLKFRVVATFLLSVHKYGRYMFYSELVG